MEKAVARYMSQDLFNALAVKLAWLSKLDAHEGRSSPAIETMLQGYKRTYAEDAFEPELRHTALVFEQWLADTHPNPPEQMAWINALRNALERYEPGGTRKRHSLFAGLWFTSVRSSPPHRLQQCIEDVQAYYESLRLGRIPL
jgi:hypothetical protein